MPLTDLSLALTMQIYEVLDNCIDEVQGGHAQNVKVQLDLITGVVSITDDGRGIPTDIHPATGKSALETVLTVLHAGGKFGGADSGYSVSGGLHGVGISVVNALSESLRITVWCVQIYIKAIRYKMTPTYSIEEGAVYLLGKSL